MRGQLSDTAAEVMGRLSAASMESYSRAYPHLVRLHMLQVIHQECLPAILTSVRHKSSLTCLGTPTVSKCIREQHGKAFGCGWVQEASDAATLVAKGCMGPIERQRVLRWDERLRITQSSLSTQACNPALWPWQYLCKPLSVHLTCQAQG